MAVPQEDSWNRFLLEPDSVPAPYCGRPSSNVPSDRGDILTQVSCTYLLLGHEMTLLCLSLLQHLAIRRAS
jgi:hypothetical protein